jgi:preprotein translocase subunit SecA
MRAAQLPMPGALWGRYPERRARRREAPPRRWLGARRYDAFARHVAGIDLTRLSDAALASRVGELRQRLALEGLAEPAMALALAMISELAARELGMRPHYVQLFAARAMLDERLAEMATGEGKTLAAALAAATAALARVPVHLITVNDYLARRDAEKLGPLYARLGLTTGVVTQEMDPNARRAAYACDITYCTAKELVFDYLRDSIVRGRDAGTLPERIAALSPQRTMLRGLCMAIIDEADSVLIDEARVPFILSRAAVAPGSPQHHRLALVTAADLSPQEHFRIDTELRRAELTPAGRALLGSRAAAAGGLWAVARYREEAVSLALCALHVLERDRDYLVRAGRVELIDATTGRSAPGRAWSRGLQQMIELKERCAPGPTLQTAAEITYQRFFARYLRVCGMSGTLSEGRSELAHVYGLPVARVPLRSPSRRVVLPTRVFASAHGRWAYVVSRARELRDAGRAVLVGTDSVADSQALSEAMHAAGLEHALLNARHDRAEAEVVADAGLPGRITVATSMAGRGTDIALHPEVARRGGLHVMLCQANVSARIDLQFLGRCARRGEAGSCETLHYLDAALPRRGAELSPRWLARILVRLRSGAAQRREQSMRRALCRQDQARELEPIVGAANL